MKKIVFVAHEFGNFNGHGGIAEYLNILVSQILKRHSEYEVYVITIEYDKKSDLLGNSRLTVYSLKPQSTHEMGKKVLKYLKEIKPDIVECTDYMALCLEALCYRNKTEKNELSRTKFVTVHHTASRECYEWNDKVPVKFAPEFVRECFLREKTQMKLSDINVAPSNFMRNYVMQNYNLSDIVTIFNPISIHSVKKDFLDAEADKKYSLDEWKDKFVISCISRIEGRKNQKLLVSQFIRFLENTNADAVLLIVGNSSKELITGDDLRNEIYEIIPEKYSCRIHFFDFMNYERKKCLYAISDVTVLASTYENFPLALVESVSHDVPVIISKYCGFTDCIGQTRLNTAFDPFKENDLSEKIKGLFEMSSAQRNDILAEQKNCLMINANYKETVDKKIQLYENTSIKHSDSQTKTLIVDINNYLNVVNSDILNNKYDGIMISFYHNPQTTAALKKIFEGIAYCFEDGAVIFYAPQLSLYQFSEIIGNWFPFYIKGVCFENFKGLKLIDVVSDYALKGEVYNITDENKGLIDKVDWTISEQIGIKRKKLWEKLLSDNFYSKYALNLEAKYVE